MNIRTWKRPHGHTFVIEFENGRTGAEYVGLNPKTGKKYSWTQPQAVAAGEQFKTVHGENWELKNIRYHYTDAETGKKIALFRFHNFEA